MFLPNRKVGRAYMELGHSIYEIRLIFKKLGLKFFSGPHFLIQRV